VPDSDTTTSQLASQFDMNPNELITANSIKGSNLLPAGRPVLVALRGNTPAPVLDSTDVPAQPAEAATLVAFAANSGPMEAATPAAAPARNEPVRAEVVRSADSTPQRVLQRAEPARSEGQPATRPVVPRSEAATVARNESKPDIIRAEPVKAEPVRIEVVRAETVRSEPLRQVALRSDNAGALGDNIPVSNPDKVVNVAAGLHTVASGDTLYNISRRYGMTVADLRNLNSLVDDTVKLGQVLKVIGSNVAAAPAASATDSSALRPASFSRPASNVSVDYVVQRGDTVFSIARKFGVSHTDILRWNNPEQLATLQPGQKVRVQSTGL